MQAQHFAPLGLKPTQVMMLLVQVVRAPVALAMVKLLKLLPEDVMVQQLPQALQGVAHLLRNRLQRIRYPCWPNITMSLCALPEGGWLSACEVVQCAATLLVAACYDIICCMVLHLVLPG